MQQHTKLAFKAREYNVTEWEPVPCDLCFWVASDVHHIFNSHRWKRKNTVDNLAVLCLKCHNKIHNKRDDLQSRQLQTRILWIISNIKERKQMIRKYSFYL